MNHEMDKDKHEAYEAGRKVGQTGGPLISPRYEGEDATRQFELRWTYGDGWLAGSKEKINKEYIRHMIWIWPITVTVLAIEFIIWQIWK